MHVSLRKENEFACPYAVLYERELPVSQRYPVFLSQNVLHALQFEVPGGHSNVRHAKSAVILLLAGLGP
jgi:hypothetical protein